MSMRQRPIKATTRASMIESWDQMDTILCALEGIGDEIPDRLVIRALTLAIWHLLRWTVMRIDKERTEKGTDAMDKKDCHRLTPMPPRNSSPSSASMQRTRGTRSTGKTTKEGTAPTPGIRTYTTGCSVRR